MNIIKKRREHIRFVIEILEIFIIVFALSWLLKTYLLGLITVKDRAMLPTLDVNHQVLMIKPIRQDIVYNRGEIVIYLDERLDQKQSVKRIIGLAGDEIEIKNGFTYVNSKPIYEPYAQTPLNYRFAKLMVPQDQVFVLNDNRSDQNDSRSVGAIPKDQLLGKAIFCFWPLSNFKKL